jgi:selenocysteine-specific elongation factor
MKHLILGTAGHIDHGKTALIQALTGIDCDTHKQEKARGITINLGFAYCDLPSGDTIGIVDVPGHRNFVRTMVGGASGIDFALLVVAADDGIMPQTREHLQIMEVLNVRAGLVAITKIDLVEPDLVDIAVEEVNELVEGTFLERCPIVKVSAVTDQGLDDLKDAISNVASELAERAASEVFRLFIDRIFTVAGFGTVVTGSVIGGTLSEGDTAYLLPGDKELRVRRLERHGKETDSVQSGDRASLNLVGLDRADFQRGMIIADRLLHSTTMIDVKLRLFEHARSLDLWSQVIFHLGTYERQGRVHLIDHGKLMAGETGLAQIHLDTPCVAQYGDHFVIRSTSNDITVGGGEIIDTAPLHHRRRTEKLLHNMTRIAQGNAAELIAAEVRKQFKALEHREIAGVLNLSTDQVQNHSTKLPADIVCYSTGENLYLIVRREHDRLIDACLKSIVGFHRRHRLEEKGLTEKELMGALGLPQEQTSQAVLALMLQKLASEKKLKRVDNTWSLADHKVDTDWDQKPSVLLVENFLRNCGMSVPLLSELKNAALKQDLAAKELDEILRFLVRKQRAYFYEGDYLHSNIVDSCRQKLLQTLTEQPQGLTIAQFRDLVNGNRRICLALIGIYDSEGITKRKGDLRILTEKGKAINNSQSTHT